MVYVVLICLITLALLALLVLGLHRYQLSIAQTNADKHNPLPPLDNISMDRDLPDLTLSDRSDLVTGQTNLFDRPASAEPGSQSESFLADSALDSKPLEDSQNQPNTAVPVESEPGIEGDLIPVEADEGEEDTEITVVETAAATAETESSELEPADVDIEVDTSPGKKPAANGDSISYQSVSSKSSSAGVVFAEHSVSAGSWQERVAELKKQDRLDEALQACRQEYPLWSAYQQASLIHRAKIKQLAQAELDVSAELVALYQLAAEASFLHDRVKGLPNLSLAQLKLLDLSPIVDLEMPYEQIGYNELRLIKKTDIKLLLDSWGKPESHRRPREIHADTWKKLCGDTQSTLF